MASHGGKRVGSGRKAGAITQRTRRIADQAAAAGVTPLEVMVENMHHFRKVALDAEATLEGLTAEEFAGQVDSGSSPEEQFKFLLAQVKKTAGFRQLAQDAARDAAPYIHPRLASVETKVDASDTLKEFLMRNAATGAASIMPTDDSDS